MITMMSRLAITSLLFTPLVEANHYIVGALGYAEVDLPLATASGERYDSQDVAVSVAYGYQFHRQWYVETGYLQLADKQESNATYEARGPYVAILGKAGNQTGELFYRVGVMSMDTRSILDTADEECISANACNSAKSIVAGMAGLGFDYYLGTASMLRVEYTYIGGQDDVKAHIVNLGWRYNF